jgi:hypothetical protein
VSRSACATAAVAVTALAAMAAAPATATSLGGSPDWPSAARSADCVPVKHSKRVVKRVRVRRGEKLVKVKRKRVARWTTCEPVASPPPPPPAGCPAPAASVGVVSRDSAGPTFTLSRDCVSAGAVEVQLQNLGEDPHDLRLRPVGPASPDPVYSVPDEAPFELGAWSGTGPPPTDSAVVSLAAGDWYLWCDLLLHEQQGMNATLRAR